MHKQVKQIAIVLPGKIILQDRDDFYRHIIGPLRTHRTTRVPGFNRNINLPTIEAEFNLSTFVRALLEKDEDTTQQITIICRGLHINVKDLCRYLMPYTGSMLLAKMTANAQS